MVVAGGAIGQADGLADMAEGYENEVAELATDTGNAVADEIESDLGELENTAANFRQNLINITNARQVFSEEELGEMQAHHVFPQEFAAQFAKAFQGTGITIHDPNYGQWIEESDHLQYADQYAQQWAQFFAKYSNPTAQQVLAFGKKVMEGVYGENTLY